MRKLLVILSKMVFCAWYRICCLQRRRDEVLFVSRQTNEPSIDFLAIGREFELRGWSAEYLVKKLSKRTMLSYVPHVFKEIRLLARCQVCVLDRYDPVVCLLNFECESISDDQVFVDDMLHTEFPKQPIVIQLWHAFGAFKKFGFQSLDTIEGHSRESAKVFAIHRNYSWVICTGEQNRTAFSEAFAYPRDRIVPLSLPKYDSLANLGNDEKSCMAELGKVPNDSTTCVLFAPTLRKSTESEHPFRVLKTKWKDSLSHELRITWSFHPLEQGCVASGGVSTDLLNADIVVTDYSSIVYEAYLLKKKVLFYVPDIEEYRLSPGLNSDPSNLAPRITFTDRSRLFDFLNQLAAGTVSYPQEDFDRFVGKTFEGCSRGTAKRIVDFAITCIESASI